MKKYILILVSIYVASCEKTISAPTNKSFIVINEIISDENLLDSYISSIYNDLYTLFNNETSNTPDANISVILGAFSDEFKDVFFPSNNILRNSYNNSYYTNEPIGTPNFFIPFYKIIIRCNVMLNDVLDEEKHSHKKYINEIKSIRSILYFYIVQLYQEAPLITSSDIDINFITPRTNTNIIINFCIDELNNVFSSIHENKNKINNSSTNFSYTERINKDVVSYYLSAFYLLKKDYNKSIYHSLSLIEKYNFESNFSKKFEIPSSENIWLLNPSFSNQTFLYNNANATFLNYKLVPSIVPFVSFTRPFSLSDSLINKMSEYDNRRINFIDSVYFESKWYYLPYKYKVTGSYDVNSLKERFVLLRLPLVYFNLIEAYYMNDQKDLSLYYLNKISSINYSKYNDIENIDLHIILKERQIEMFGEMGDRWLTLKRTNLIDSIMKIYVPLKSKGENKWDPNQMLYLPIPISETTINPNL
ncbi:RagB/SusD family nutrient uptake outer membrane protein [Gynurincola endophyticus]|uniref:RagB/SusD family nutrient uptake outer membrane protein n=1 Tax=Gynurincola endophyticus TaxID=2479004 RepID=UPI000F8D09BD|nr:RagB/SusD family nutrient uptake outer membrane protein [Gynurincola endophyticus]